MRPCCIGIGIGMQACWFKNGDFDKLNRKGCRREIKCQLHTKGLSGRGIRSGPMGSVEFFLSLKIGKGRHVNSRNSALKFILLYYR